MTSLAESSEVTVDEGVAISNMLQWFVDENKLKISILILLYDLKYPAIIISVGVGKVYHHSKFNIILPKMIQ